MRKNVYPRSDTVVLKPLSEEETVMLDGHCAGEPTFRDARTGASGFADAVMKPDGRA